MISLYMGEKRMPIMNSKIVNAKKCKVEFKRLLKYGISIYSLRFLSLAGTQIYKRDYVKKTRAIKLKIQEKHMTSTSLLMFSPEFSLERELYDTSVLSSHS